MKTSSLIDRTAWALTALYALDRLLKLLAIFRFFRRPPPPAPPLWPAITLLCPITRSPNDLRRVLQARAQLAYPGPLTTLLICDSGDHTSQAICRELMAAYPAWQAQLLTVQPDDGVVASKIAKLLVGLEHAAGDLFCFVDDDVALPGDALRILTPYALQPDVGAAFGLARYSAWDTLAESLMSGFVNTNALFSYVPITYLVEPFTITGHCFMMRREVFAEVGGLNGMAGRIDDDHELARRVRRHGLRNLQTPLIYAVENRLDTLADYHNQMRRWFLIPRRTMLPFMGRREQIALFLSSLGSLLPAKLAFLALLTRRRAPLAALCLNLVHFSVSQAMVEHVYLKAAMPPHRLWLLPILAWITPLHTLLAASGNDTIRWRGQLMRIERGGRFRVIAE